MRTESRIDGLRAEWKVPNDRACQIINCFKDICNARDRNKILPTLCSCSFILVDSALRPTASKTGYLDSPSSSLPHSDEHPLPISLSLQNYRERRMIELIEERIDRFQWNKLTQQQAMLNFQIKNEISFLSRLYLIEYRFLSL